MGLSKEQVERHIAGVEKRLGNTQEVSTFCLNTHTTRPDASTCMGGGDLIVLVLLYLPQRAHHGYEFARLCVEVKKHQEAIRYGVYIPLTVSHTSQTTVPAEV